MFGVTPENLVLFVLVFARAYTFINFLPLVGGDTMPALIRAIFIMSFTPFIVMPMLAQGVSYQLAAPFYLLLIKELAVGILMAFVIGLPLKIPEIIGDIIDNQRGAAVTDSYNPASGEQTSILGQLLSLTIVTYFFTEGGLNILIGLLGQSFQLNPATDLDFTFGNKNMQAVLLDLFSNYLHLFAILALPVMVAMFMAEISLAIASRFAQSLNVFSLAQPIKAAIALAMMVPLLPKINAAVLEATRTVMRMFGDV